jgi:hypothetical protein
MTQIRVARDMREECEAELQDVDDDRSVWQRISRLRRDEAILTSQLEEIPAPRELSTTGRRIVAQFSMSDVVESQGDGEQQLSKRPLSSFKRFARKVGEKFGC